MKEQRIMLSNEMMQDILARGNRTDLPIIFSGEMVRAILDGRKIQTRQVMWPESLQYIYRDSMEKIFVRKTPSHYLFDLRHDNGTVSTIYGTRQKYVVSDWLWVRETWAHDDQNCFDVHCGNRDHIWWKANEAPIVAESFSGTAKWRPSIYMPRWASRITLEATNVRVERVQDISYADALAEGVWRPGPDADPDKVDREYDAVVEFHRLWNEINAKRGFGWDVNPWVWVIEFKRVEG